MNTIIKNNGVRYGLIAAVLSTVYSYVVYAINEDIFLQWYLTLIVQLLGIVLCVIAVVQSRKMMGGYIVFREAFSAFMIGAIVLLAISLASSLLLFQVIDVDLGERLKDKMLVQMEERFAKSNMSEEQTDQIMQRMEEQDTFGLATQFKSTLYGVVFYAVIGAIVALILKRNPPLWQTAENENTIDA